MSPPSFVKMAAAVGPACRWEWLLAVVEILGLHCGAHRTAAFERGSPLGWTGELRQLEPRPATGGPAC
ncbi:hypothetical protein NDU88_005985 [Pleurodeles waltl]|uniref:Uncharacterized protein n=1 Tax=Pleurodeles waltl TaxID=8319 RepID=A0AAV7SNI3_PLEWA|nr:hypothetical protein NDU88_005985 [Pleurodeles waltl]